MMEVMQVGKLQLSKNSPINDSLWEYGQIYHGCFYTCPVRIQSLLKKDFKIDIGILQKSQSHPNVIRFYCAEENNAYQ